jgi:hypothetical protein
VKITRKQYDTARAMIQKYKPTVNAWEDIISKITLKPGEFVESAEFSSDGKFTARLKMDPDYSDDEVAF